MSDISVLLSETRRFAPPADFARDAHIRDRSVHDAATADPIHYWAEQAYTLQWRTRWQQVLDWQPPELENKIDIRNNQE